MRRAMRRGTQRAMRRVMQRAMRRSMRRGRDGLSTVPCVLPHLGLVPGRGRTPEKRVDVRDVKRGRYLPVHFFQITGIVRRSLEVTAARQGGGGCPRAASSASTNWAVDLDHNFDNEKKTFFRHGVLSRVCYLGPCNDNADEDDVLPCFPAPRGPQTGNRAAVDPVVDVERERGHDNDDDDDDKSSMWLM
jgi:hypothetical protein